MKDSPLFDILGEIDELNVLLGIVASYIPEERDFIRRTQEYLIAMSSAIYSNGVLTDNEKKLKEFDEHTPFKEMDRFILPATNHISFHVHLARTKARKVERMTVSYYGESYVSEYFNKMSKYLYYLAISKESSL